MTPEDIARIYATAEQAMANAKVAAMSQSKADMVAAKQEINEALTAVDGVSTFFDSIVKQYQGKREQADDKRRALGRAFDSVKDAYFLLRDEEKRTENS